MLYYLTKLMLSAAIIVVSSEVAKANATLGALSKSLPMISIQAMTWPYVDTRDVGKIAELSVSTFWLVLPTLSMFLVAGVTQGRLWFLFISVSGSQSV